jgi:small subunit ribosomal protein S9
LENLFSATGKRKNAIARIKLKPGKGERIVNGLPIKEYLRSDTLIKIVEQPFTALQISGSYDLVAKVNGGGISGQSGAIQLGVSRALSRISEEYHKRLRKEGMLTRDSRSVERKKYGRPGARKRFQFSKR